jgi:hypothetical protein
MLAISSWEIRLGPPGVGFPYALYTKKNKIERI